MITTTVPNTDINFAEFAIELSEIQRSINTFLDFYYEGQDAKPSFDLLIWQINNLANLYS